AYCYPGVIRDAAGNLYGVTDAGGAYGAGTVFKVDSGDNETLLYSFTGYSDGKPGDGRDVHLFSPSPKPGNVPSVPGKRRETPGNPAGRSSAETHILIRKCFRSDILPRYPPYHLLIPKNFRRHFVSLLAG